MSDKYKILLERFPLLFPSEDAETPFNDWGFEVPDGWYDLIENTCRVLYNHYRNAQWRMEYAEKMKDKDPSLFEKYSKELEEETSNLPVFTQIKEKFGTLRLYADNVNDYSDGIIGLAESLSEHICKHCGNKVHENNCKNL